LVEDVYLRAIENGNLTKKDKKEISELDAVHTNLLDKQGKI
jgi:hypothetical protein